MARPKLLLLDEPSMGLAPIFVEKIFEIVREINEQGTPILLVEQNALMALDTADRGYVLETGRIALADDAKSAARERAGPQDVPRRGLAVVPEDVVHPGLLGGWWLPSTAPRRHRMKFTLTRGSVRSAVGCWSTVVERWLDGDGGGRGGRDQRRAPAEVAGRWRAEASSGLLIAPRRRGRSRNRTDERTVAADLRVAPVAVLRRRRSPRCCDRPLSTVSAILQSYRWASSAGSVSSRPAL